jgi:rhodanese-related sulfurtransferase
VVAGSEGEALAAAWAIERDGRGPVRGILAGGIEAYAAAGFELGCLESLSAERVADDLALGGAVMVDAREDDDWVRGHVPGSLHVPLRSVARAAAVLPSAPLVVACADGSRAATVACILRRLGHTNVWRVAGAGVPYLLSRRLNVGGV